MIGKVLLLLVIGWSGARCEVDIDECALGLVSCGPGDCQNLEGSYTCVCATGYCGAECALPDPCFEPADVSDSSDNSTTGPCRNGGACTQRCAATVDWLCACVDGWQGRNCTESAALGAVDGNTKGVVVGVVVAVVALAAAGGAVAALAAQARRKRATRGTYSPSGQEYCNPRAEMMHHALKPPPEERLI